jgi:sphingolipid delta-4 desaturase
MRMNQIFAIICNLPQILPSAIGFGRYHRDHHTYLGDAIKDPDIPTLFEVRMMRSWVSRLFYVLFMPFFYGLRPYVKAPKQISFMEVVNIIACVAYAMIIAKFFMWKSVGFLLMCTYFGLSVHPVSAHVIAEHYEFYKKQDTYSYYGIINYINFNMGIHIEHHDFPNIAWYNLPKVRKIAPEFYDNLPQMDSYVLVIFKYIFDGSIGPWSRISLVGKLNKTH